MRIGDTNHAESVTQTTQSGPGVVGQDHGVAVDPDDTEGPELVKVTLLAWIAKFREAKPLAGRVGQPVVQVREPRC